MNKYKVLALQLALFFIILIIWQISANSSQKIMFLFGSPYLIFQALIAKPEEWLSDTFVTGMEALLGFVLGVSIGSAVGFGLLYSENITKFTKPYIIALGSIPIFAIAPMLIIWFGTGLQMKIASAFFATVLVALSQSYEGGRSIDSDLLNLFKLYNSSNKALFLKLILPSSLNWVFASFKLNIGFALLGAFIGEFIASEQGLGHEILSAGGVYDFPRVFAATLCIILLALGLNFLVSLAESFRYQIIEWLTVPKILRKDIS